MFGTERAMVAGRFFSNDVVSFLVTQWTAGICAGDGRLEDSWGLVEWVALKFHHCDLREALNVIRAYCKAGHVGGIYRGEDLKFVNAIEYLIQMALARQSITWHRENNEILIVIRPVKSGQVWHHIRTWADCYADAAMALLRSLTHSLANGY